MSRPALVFLVKFKTSLSLEEVTDVIHSRIDQFRAFPGLQQKYYLQDRATREVAGLYLWESDDAFTQFMESELRATIADAYQTEGSPRVEIFDLVEVLRD